MKRILIIDDAEFARMTLRLILQEHGYIICGEAEDGIQGFEKFKELRPDLTLCDIRMHGISGFDCIKMILEEDADAKVVVCTAINSQKQMEDIKKSGARGVINKPISAKELTGLIQEIFSGAAEQISYKTRMGKRAEEEGIAQRPLLDFYSAFNSINGFPLDDGRADKQYLQKNAEGVLIGVRAVLSAKISMSEIEKLERIFREVVFSPNEK